MASAPICPKCGSISKGIAKEATIALFKDWTLSRS